MRLVSAKMEMVKMTKEMPRGRRSSQRFRDSPTVMRPCPSVDDLRLAFTDEQTRRQRRSDGIDVVAFSTLYETAPVGGPDNQGPYLNAALAADTTLAADDLLAKERSPTPRPQ